jgi:hypothetical protein
LRVLREGKQERDGLVVERSGADREKGWSMGIGVSLLLIAIGAILTWAVSADVSGVDLNTVGVILMVVGAVGGLISLVFWSSWGGFGSGGRDTAVVHDRERVVER